MSSASEKAADKMHADLTAMMADMKRHGTAEPKGSGTRLAWSLAFKSLRNALAQVEIVMSERDRRIASNV